MKYLKSFEDIIGKKDDIGILSDLFLEFNEKWGLEVYMNEKGMGDDIFQIQKFDKFLMIDVKPYFLAYVTIRKTNQTREFRNDLQNVISRIQKFGYEVSPSDINSASFGTPMQTINIDGRLKDPYYFFMIWESKEVSESFWSDRIGLKKKRNKDDDEYDRIFNNGNIKYDDETPDGHRPLMQDEINDIKDLFVEYEEKWISDKLISTQELSWNEKKVDKGEISIEIPIEVRDEFKNIYKDLRPYVSRLKSFGFTTEEGIRHNPFTFQPYYYIDIYSICD